MKYSVEFTVEATYEIEINGVYYCDEAEYAAREAVEDIDCGKMDIIDDFRYDTSTILYDELEWDEDSGCGGGRHEIIGTIDIEVEASSPEAALEEANKKYEEVTNDYDQCRITFGMDICYVNLQYEPTLDNVLEVKNKHRISIGKE